MAKKKILIIDDEAGLTRMVKLNLEATGFFEVEIQNDPLQAVETAKRFQPDLVLLDVMMPEIDGITTEELGASSGMLGGEAFLAKPVDSKDLIRYIQMKLNG
jgi:CheY-like chemotaxis protein